MEMDGVAVLNGGFIGGPIAPSPTYFDGITLELVLGVAQNEAAEVPLFRFAPDGEHIAVSAGADEFILVHDALGKLIHQERASSTGWHTLALPEGVNCLVVTVEGDGQRRSQRLVSAH